MVQKRSREVFIRPPEEQVFTCPMCFSSVPMGAIHCPHCGKDFVEDIKMNRREKSQKRKLNFSSAGEDLLEYLEGSKEWMESPKDHPKRTINKNPEPPVPPWDREEEEDFEDRPHPKDTLKDLVRDKLIFYTGLALIITGGPGLAFGSWLHDVFRVPILGETYNAFGWLNVLFAMAGVIVLFVGVVFLVFSLKGGVISEEELRILKSEG